ncbi:hypothetical protein F4692_001782 [Nocardioides cavernae]|uniref:Uncharacterized protein n=1 Tax=Nocardioides cavernae TaxID=1921566 RepID=A0A7Y9H2A1_9ACTN|nr:hypothetical protein [Nocardioides cavernae]NYE36649.1 hypothetical protein [Nocardioides cavernae]
MSKMDNLRAMREARYAEAQKRAGSAPARPKAAKAPVAPAAPKTVETRVEEATGDDLCGHRNISGRSCTREKGHPQKSHRYS